MNSRSGFEPRLRPIPSAAVVHALRMVGFSVKLDNAVGTALTRNGRVVVVPNVPRLGEGALRLILIAASMTEEDVARVFDALPPPPKVLRRELTPLR